MKVIHEYADGIDENDMDDPRYHNQVILPICAVPSDEQPFPLNYWKKFILWLAGGTNCRCCMGYRIFGGFVLGGLIGLASGLIMG